MTAYKQTAKTIDDIIGNRDCMAVAKLPIREMVTKVIPGEKYLCTDTGEYSIAKVICTPESGGKKEIPFEKNIQRGIFLLNSHKRR